MQWIHKEPKQERNTPHLQMQEQQKENTSEHSNMAAITRENFSSWQQHRLVDFPTHTHIHTPNEKKRKANGRFFGCYIGENDMNFLALADIFHSIIWQGKQLSSKNVLYIPKKTLLFLLYSVYSVMEWWCWWWWRWWWLLYTESQRTSWMCERIDIL
jgi:hypothetical protein